MLEGATFVGVTGIALLASRVVSRQIAIRERLGQGGAAPARVRSVVREQRVRSPVLNWIEARSFLNEPGERRKLDGLMVKAGFEHPAAAAWYVVARYGLALGLPVMLLAWRTLSHHPAVGMSAQMMPLAMCGLGLKLPQLWLKRRIAHRQLTIEQQFPDALDLLVICVDAGLGLDAAIMRTQREMQRSHPDIAREFERVSEELAAGRSNADALRHMGERLNIPAIRGFVSLLVQSQSLGASIAQGLKTYAGEMRATRAMKAEEKAMRIPVLMSVPLVACFLPVIVVALLLPTAIDVVRHVIPDLRAASSAHVARH